MFSSSVKNPQHVGYEEYQHYCAQSYPCTATIAPAAMPVVETEWRRHFSPLLIDSVGATSQAGLGICPRSPLRIMIKSRCFYLPYRRASDERRFLVRLTKGDCDREAAHRVSSRNDEKHHCARLRADRAIEAVEKPISCGGGARTTQPSPRLY